jgi:glycosyltransferase involved in cell wall biosynthesis
MENKFKMLDLVSVIVPMYNHVRYIEQCLNSVYNEDYPNIELIIIDDGSKDESVEVAKKWRESHPGKFHRFYLETQENQGICKTLNRLVSVSEGEYIVFLASDDYLLNRGIEAKITALKKNPQWLAVCGDVILVDPEGNIVSDSAIDYYKVNRNTLNVPHLFSREIIMRWGTPFQTMFFQKKAFDPTYGVGNYDENLPIEDRGMCLRLLSRSSYGFVDFPCYAYRVKQYYPRPQLDGKDWWVMLSEKYSSKFSGINRLYLQLDYQQYIHRKTWLYMYSFRVFMKMLRWYHHVDSFIYQKIWKIRTKN